MCLHSNHDKISEIPQMRDLPYSPKNASARQDKLGKELFQITEDQGDLTARHNEHYWMGSWMEGKDTA